MGPSGIFLTMGTFIGVIFGIFLALFILGLLKAGITKLVQYYPALIFVFGIMTFVALLAFHWIVAIIGALIVMGVLVSWQEKGDKCKHCGSYRTREILHEPETNLRVWECDECHDVSGDCKIFRKCPHCDSVDNGIYKDGDFIVIMCRDCKKIITWFKPNKP